ncbi:MAG: hypothetical protein ACAF41_10170 [Leptolyngbya sp. BL-A-14]
MVLSSNESLHRITLFLKFNASPVEAQDYHAQAKVFKETWQTIKEQPLPWYVRLNSTRLLLMVD